MAERGVATAVERRGEVQVRQRHHAQEKAQQAEQATGPGVWLTEKLRRARSRWIVVVVRPRPCVRQGSYSAQGEAGARHSEDTRSL